ncbi:hypothetical protein IQ266_26580 [filamentous cyanobacterium LEGE 11480]|uniref:Uncharacterized protein n=2 Tax=Romeriopsis TaxID=2992131 RepID=A0A928Z600_9CYAN|nr:hypothetical protein [Romeriopsis navalis LEGE 11480]
MTAVTSLPKKMSKHIARSRKEYLDRLEQKRKWKKAAALLSFMATFTVIANNGFGALHHVSLLLKQHPQIQSLITQMWKSK